jgi:hypothetical protein
MARSFDHTDCSHGTFTRSTASIRLDLTGQASGASVTFDLDALLLTQRNKVIPANAKIIGAHVECETALGFSAGTTTGATLVVGIVGTTNGFLASAAVEGLTAGQTSDLGGNGTLVNRIRANSAPALVAVLTATGGTPDVDEIDEGVLLVHLEYVLCKTGLG